MACDRSGRVDVAELRRHLGERREVQAEIADEEFVVGSSRVDATDPFEVDVTLESISEGISATGHVRAHWHGICRRCLDEVEGELVAPVSEIFSTHPIEGETYPIGNNQIDLSDLARDAVLLDLPTAPLCAEDCPGPAADLFPVSTAVDADDVAAAPMDPRWAALDVLREPPSGQQMS